MADESSAIDTNQLRDHLSRWIAADAGLGPGEVVTAAVVVFCTEQMVGDTVNHGHGRVYPLDGMSPTVELGLLEQAVRDARNGD